jgi:hypothetical protein
VRRATVKIPRTCSPSHFGSGACEPLKLRACHDASRRGFSYLIPTRHSPQPVRRATRLPSAYGVLETPPLPVTPPPCGDRWHDIMAESRPPLRVQQYNSRPRVAITGRMRSIPRRGVSVPSACCEALRAEQQVDAPHPPRCRGREASAPTSYSTVSG